MKEKLNKMFQCFNTLNRPASPISLDDSIEAKYVERYFESKHWNELNVKDLHENYPGDPAACISFMNLGAFLYFFPGFMKIALLEYETADAIFDTVVNRLFIAAQKDGNEQRKIFENYSDQCLKAIAQFLELMSEEYCKYYPEDRAALALDLYWKKYL